MKKDIIIGVLLLVIGVVLGVCLCRQFYSPERVVEVQKDTTFLIDTLVIEKPSETKRETIKESVLVEVRDTMWIHDTCYIALPLEKRTYRRDEFYAEVTGYEPRLTYIEVYPKTVTISKTETVKEKKNYLAVGTELGWCVTPSIPIYLEYTRKLHRNVELNAGVFHDLVLGETGFRFGINANIGW